MRTSGFPELTAAHPVSGDRVGPGAIFGTGAVTENVPYGFVVFRSVRTRQDVPRRVGSAWLASTNRQHRHASLHRRHASTTVATTATWSPTSTSDSAATLGTG